jgi:hypothetical protein
MIRLEGQAHELNDVQLMDEERQPCEVWTRVMGYHRPVASFNIGKKGEFAERRFFMEKAGTVHPLHPTECLQRAV